MHKVLKAFNEGKASYNGSFRTTGSELYSYGFCIAWKEDGHVKLSPRFFDLHGYGATPTTNRHLGVCAGIQDTFTGKVLTKVSPGTWKAI